MENKSFKCTKCENLEFEAWVDAYEAPPCPKCHDSEYVERGGYIEKGRFSRSWDDRYE